MLGRITNSIKKLTPSNDNSQLPPPSSNSSNNQGESIPNAKSFFKNAASRAKNIAANTASSALETTGHLIRNVVDRTDNLTNTVVDEGFFALQNSPDAIGVPAWIVLLLTKIITAVPTTAAGAVSRLLVKTAKIIAPENESTVAKKIQENTEQLKQNEQNRKDRLEKRKRIIELNNKLRELTSTNTTKIDILKGRIYKLETEITTLTEKKNISSDSKIDIDIVKYKTKIQEFQKEIDELQKEIEELQKEIDELQIELTPTRGGSNTKTKRHRRHLKSRKSRKH